MTPVPMVHLPVTGNPRIRKEQMDAEAAERQARRERAEERIGGVEPPEHLMPDVLSIFLENTRLREQVAMYRNRERVREIKRELRGGDGE